MKIWHCDAKTNLYAPWHILIYGTHLFPFLLLTLKAKQRAEVLQSTHRFFEQQQHQQSKPPVIPQPPKTTPGVAKPSDSISEPSLVSQEKVEENQAAAVTLPPAAVPTSTKPIRTGPIKPQAIKSEDTKS